MVFLVMLLRTEHHHHLLVVVPLEYLPEVRVFLHVQLREELVSVLELGRVVRRKAILRHHLHRSLSLIRSVLHEATVRRARYASCHGHHS